MTPAVRRCVDSDRVDRVVHEQAAAAARDGIAGTPTLRLEDHATGRTLLLPGPVEGDALLSAIDLLIADVAAPAAAKPAPLAAGK
jgi:predicted DsbA family dithiol-disulfide isomerase